jgi:hypothetical protein
VGDLEAQPEEVPHLLEESDDLRVEIDLELERSPELTVLRNVEETTGDLQVSTVDVDEPGVVDRAGVELVPERLRLGLETLTVGVVRPFLAEDVLDALHVVEELTLDLLRPHDCTGDGRVVAELRHVVSFRGLVARLELVLKAANVLLNRVDELRLVLGDGACSSSSQRISFKRRKESKGQKERTSNLRPNEKSIELAEDAEHLVGVPSPAETVPQARDDVVLDASDSLVVGRFRRDPDLSSL